MSKEKHYDKDGRYSGSSAQSGDKEKHYDRDGRFSGSSTRSGDKEKHYDKDGRFSGSSTRSGDKEKHYDKDGRFSGSSTQSGDKEKHYDKDGRFSGSSEKSSDGCFVTTACIEAKGLPDDCAELNVLRKFRNEYVRNLLEGDKIIQEYYEIAPLIVAGIDKRKNSNDVYEDLYERLVKKCLELIKADKKDEAYANYLLVLNELKQRYL